MIEVLPISSLREEDSLLFGNLNVLLGKLVSSGLPVARGVVVTAPSLHLQTVLENYDFGSHHVFEQSLTLVKKDLEKIPDPEVLQYSLKSQQKFLAHNFEYSSVRALWLGLLGFWLGQVKQKLWATGFSPNLTQNLVPVVITFIDNLKSFGVGFIDPESKEMVVRIDQGKLEPKELYQLDELIVKAQRKLLINHQFKWILDKEIKLIGILPFIDSVIANKVDESNLTWQSTTENHHVALHDDRKSSVKVFLDLSTSLIVEHPVDGIFISSEKIFDLNKPQDSFEQLVFKLVESAATFPNSPVLVKLADKSEGMGKVRGTLRLIHQQNLLNPLLEAIEFARDKKEFRNIELVIPFVRGVSELMEIKKLLAIKKMTRTSIKQWLEVAVPENILNLEDYLITGVDGVVLNLDELVAHLNGFDPLEQELTHYKHEIIGLVKFLEDSLKILHKANVPFIAVGSLTLNPIVLEFLVSKGLHGIVVDRFEASAIKDLLHQTEKRIIVGKMLS